MPACKTCNDLKAGNAWEIHPKLHDDRRDRIATYVAEYGYGPDVEELQVVLGKLYELADRQTRAGRLWAGGFPALHRRAADPAAPRRS